MILRVLYITNCENPVYICEDGQYRTNDDLLLCITKFYNLDVRIVDCQDALDKGFWKLLENKAEGDEWQDLFYRLWQKSKDYVEK